MNTALLQGNTSLHCTTESVSVVLHLFQCFKRIKQEYVSDIYVSICINTQLLEAVVLILLFIHPYCFHVHYLL